MTGVELDLEECGSEAMKNKSFGGKKTEWAAVVKVAKTERTWL